MLRRALVLAIVLYAVAVHGAAPSNNLVNKWAYDATAKKFTVSEGAATSCQGLVCCKLSGVYWTLSVQWLCGSDLHVFNVHCCLYLV